LKPAQQATFIKQEMQVSTLNEPALSRITAWKSGFFNFEGLSLQEAMRQLERWYDIDVSYENGIPAISFWGKMERSLSLESLLQLLKGSKLHFRREGDRKLVIINSPSSL
jgi:Golgi nucleoside diphosphatase